MDRKLILAGSLIALIPVIFGIIYMFIANNPMDISNVAP
ncbi:hypothetical protein PAECIP112173_00326 [Paenibacillus sp. JJ-100]|nr:hypothetical protein PAECIP112173_00326 [Paenibacillus sp. JJ-100]